MANICENEIHVYTSAEANKKYILKYLEDNLNADITESDNDYIEGYFSSKWDFPDQLMDEMYKGIPIKSDIDITVLSTEWGCFYCAFHTCNEDGWKLE